MEMLIGIGVAAIAFVLFSIASLIIIAKFRIVPETDEAVVITGTTVKEKDEESGEIVQKPKVVVGGGTYVIPIWNKYKIVSLEVVQIPIEWKGGGHTAGDIQHVGEGATLPSKDRIPVILEGELSVVVDGRNEDQIILASQKLGIPTRGTSKAKEFSMASAVQRKADKIVAAALRTAVFEFEFVELNAKKEEFEKRVHALVQQDLAKYGLTLVSVSIPLVSQGQFSSVKGDMFDEQGRKKVAEIVEAAQTAKNDIEQENAVARARRDREAKEQQLQIEREVAEKVADQEREVAVYQANQQRQQTEATLNETKAEELAKAQQAREVIEAQAHEAEKEKKAEIAKLEAVAVAQATARAAQKEADEQAAIREANAGASRKVAEEQAEQEKLEAEIAKNKAVETAKIAKQKEVEAAEIAKAKEIEAAEIAKQQAVEVAEQGRQQAVETAEVDRQKAVAEARAEEAAARATQAKAEEEQKKAEEAVITTQETAQAQRKKDVAVVQANEEREKEQINADKSAYVEAMKAEGERDAALKRAEAVQAKARGVADAEKTEAEGHASAQEAKATGEANAKKATATGEADALTIAATAYATDRVTRAEAGLKAAEQEAQARKMLADATLEEGKATAEAIRLKVEAENKVDPVLLLRDVSVKLIENAPDIVREIMAPVGKIPADVKILQVHGIGGGEDGEGVQGLPKTLLETGLVAAGITPFLKEATNAITANPDVQDMATTLGGIATKALAEAAGAVKNAVPDNGGPAPSEAK